MFRRTIIIACCCAAISNAMVARAFQSPKPLPVTTIPFDPANNLIVIDVTINARGPFRFMIDTGSSVNVVSRELADTMGLKIGGSAKVEGGGNTLIDAALTDVSEVRIGDLILRNRSFFVASLPKEWPLQGILGAPFLKELVVTIDFAHSQLTLTSSQGSIQPSPGARIRIKLRGGLIPEAKGEIDGFSGWLKIDTGYNGSLALFAEFIERHPSLFNKDSLAPTYPAGGQTVSGEVGETRVVQIKALKLKTAKGLKVMREKLPAALLTEKGGSNSVYAGAIGTLALQPFRVIFDYGKKLMILERPEGH